MTRRAQQALQGALASAIAVCLAAVSHTLGGGGAPAWWLVGSAIVLGTPIATALAGLRARRIGIVGSVLAAQLILHAGFSLTGAHAIADDLGTTAPAHQHGLILTPSVEADPGIAVGISLGMVLAHACAALLTIALLLRGDRALRAVTSWIRALLALPEPAEVAVRPRQTPIRTAVRRRRPERCSPRTRRGPPVRSLPRTGVTRARSL